MKIPMQIYGYNGRSHTAGGALTGTPYFILRDGAGREYHYAAEAEDDPGPRSRALSQALGRQRLPRDFGALLTDTAAVTAEVNERGEVVAVAALAVGAPKQYAETTKHGAAVAVSAATQEKLRRYGVATVAELEQVLARKVAAPAPAAASPAADPTALSAADRDLCRRAAAHALLQEAERAQEQRAGEVFSIVSDALRA